MRKNSTSKSEVDIMDFFDKFVDKEDQAKEYQSFFKKPEDYKLWGQNTPFNDLLASGGCPKFFTLQENEKDSKMEPLWNNDDHENLSM
jgi:hypothetical protein